MYSYQPNLITESTAPCHMTHFHKVHGLKKPGLQGLNTWTWWMLSSMDIITNHHNKPQNHRVVGGKGHFLTLAFNSSFTQWNNKTLRRRFEKWIKLKSCEKKWPRKCHNESMKSIHFIHLAPPKSFKFKSACEGEEVQRYISLKGVSLNVRGALSQGRFLIISPD